MKQNSSTVIFCYSSTLLLHAIVLTDSQLVNSIYFKEVILKCNIIWGKKGVWHVFNVQKWSQVQWSKQTFHISFHFRLPKKFELWSHLPREKILLSKQTQHWCCRIELRKKAWFVIFYELVDLKTNQLIRPRVEWVRNVCGCWLDNGRCSAGWSQKGVYEQCSDWPRETAERPPRYRMLLRGRDSDGWRISSGRRWPDNEQWTLLVNVNCKNQLQQNY